MQQPHTTTYWKSLGVGLPMKRGPRLARSGHGRNVQPLVYEEQPLSISHQIASGKETACNGQSIRTEIAIVEYFASENVCGSETEVVVPQRQ